MEWKKKREEKREKEKKRKRKSIWENERVAWLNLNTDENLKTKL